MPSMPPTPTVGGALETAAGRKRDLSDHTIREAASLLWGVSLSCAWFALVKVVQHSRSALRRRKQYNVYILLLWGTWLPTLGLSLLTWLRLEGLLPDRLWTFLSIIVLWTIQLQCVLQVIVNRLSFLILDRRRSQAIKLAVLFIVAFITVAGGCTWIMASIRLSTYLVEFSHVFDRANKGLFAVTDLALNAAFLYLLWRQLIAAGLAKYWSIFRYNGCCIVLSISLDIILIGVESASSKILYVQFNPVVYFTKLYIEMKLAEMMARVVRSANEMNTLSMTAIGTARSQEDLDMATMVIEDDDEWLYGERVPQSPRS